MLNSINPPIHSRLFVHDLDRCLITEELYRVFDDVVKESSLIDVHLYHEDRSKLEAAGGSFDEIGWLLSQVGFGNAEYKHLLEEYIAKAYSRPKSDFLSPGAQELLTRLEISQIPQVIMTYGSTENQIAKIKAARLEEVPYMVVSHRHKAHYINEWWDDTKNYFEAQINNDVVRAHSIILIDDKASAFNELPSAPRASGYWLKSKNLLPSQRGEIPANVTVIRSLEEIIDYEKLR